MAKAKEKTTGFYFKCSPDDMAFIEKRMEQTGIRNKSAFIRKMCIDGHVFVLQMDTLQEIGRLLRYTSNNANQLAKAVNSGYGAHRNDVDEVNENLAAIRNQFGELLTILTEVTDAKPGKRFTSPLRYSDLKNLPDSSPPEMADGGVVYGICDDGSDSDTIKGA
jgi:hypothetical protein